jgi:5-methylcytosine-specific restriction endonuclease McrA
MNALERERDFFRRAALLPYSAAAQESSAPARKEPEMTERRRGIPPRRRYLNPNRVPSSGWEAYIARYPERAAFYRSPAWTLARTRQLMREPDCQFPGCTAPATSVDHVLSRAEGGADLVPENLQSMCKEHHKRKTLHESHRGNKRRKGGS